MKSKYYKDSPEAVARRNGIAQITYKMVGGKDALYRLDSDSRADLRQAARYLYDAGQTTTAAESFIQKSSAGFVYVLGNPAWPGRYKIGRAVNPQARLCNYNTGCPNRGYYYVGYEYFEDCNTAEETAHTMFASDRLHGEWFNIKAEQATTYLKILKELEHDEHYCEDTIAEDSRRDRWHSQ